MTDTWLYTMDEAFETPLSRAMHSNHSVLAALLLQQDRADREAGLAESSLLHRAAVLGLEHVVEALLAEGNPVDAADKLGETALHKAVRNGHLSITQRLLGAGGNSNALSMQGLTPLHWAALTGDSEMVELLLSAGGDALVSAPHLDNLTPLAIARIMGYTSVAIRLTELAVA